MAVLRPRNDPVRLFGRRLILLGLFALIVLSVMGVWSAYQKEKESRLLRKEAEVQLSDLSQRQAQLDADIASLETDRGKEQVLREQYALAARGEGLIVIVDTPPVAPTRATSSLVDWFKKTFTWW
ncbi:MAG: hypothetical protein Q7R90_01255 [bacterium]|nr:hypothetical protein [bacterium]